MPKSQKINSASRASTKKQKDSKSTLFAKLRTKYHNLAPHQQASLKRIAIQWCYFDFYGTYVYRIIMKRKSFIFNEEISLG
jgi:hypothetical protein